jgi:hypothetical protein
MQAYEAIQIHKFAVVSWRKVSSVYVFTVLKCTIQGAPDSYAQASW